jgi:small subunit ribosomal protein S2
MEVLQNAIQKNTKQNKSFQTTPKKRFEKENLQQGDIFTVKITALGSKNIGIAELRNGTTLLVPNTKCGEKVQVKIERVFFGQEAENKKKVKYAIGTVYQTGSADVNRTGMGGLPTTGAESSLKTGKGNGETKTERFSGKSFKFDFKVGQKFKVTIQKKGPKNSGFVPVSTNFLIIVPNAKVGEKLVIEIQKIKQNYAFATIVGEKSTSSTKKEFDLNTVENQFIGQEFHIDLPVSVKTFGNFYVVKLNGQIVFVKKGLGVQPGERVQIQIQKATQNFAIAKIQKISPLSLEERKVLVKQGIQKMIQSSMHFGEKSIHCNANMRKYLWYRKKGLRLSSPFNLSALQNSSLDFGRIHQSSESSFFSASAVQSNESLLYLQLGHSNGKGRIPHFTNFQSSANQDQIHVGHLQNGSLSRFAKTFQGDDQKPMVKRGRHIFNVLKTQHCLNHALKQLAKYAAKGKTFLFVGTKKPAASLIAKTALLSHTSFFVNTRWLGGMLTNWKTILKSIAQIRPILKQKQKIQKKIFEKRQKIQRRLFQKVFLLRKKSQKFLNKGKYLISQISTSQISRAQKSQKFMQRKNVLFAANRSLVDAAKKLKAKKIERFQKIQAFEIAAAQISIKKKQLQSLIAKNIRKFAELEKFYELGQEFLKLKSSFLQNGEKNKKLVAVSYEKIEKMKEQGQADNGNWQVPNPSPEIFKKMISILLHFKKGNFVLYGAGQKSIFDARNFGSNFDQLFGEKGEAKAFSNRSKSSEVSKQKGNTILFSKFLKKFILFLPFLQNSLKQLSSEILLGQKILSNFQKTYEKIVGMQKTNKEIYQKTVAQFSLVCSKLVLQRKNFEIFKLSFKQFAAEQRLLKFLPKLRFFPTSQAKMYETIEFFMKKFVDPKLIYPMEQIYDQKLKFTSKKIATTRKQKWQRLEKYFGGITKMAKMNAKQISKNVAIIVGQQEEMSAVLECRKLGMKIFAIVDTNCDPKFVDHIIPANDDSRNSIHYVLGEMLRYIRLGQKLRRKISFLRITNVKMQQSMKQKRRF